MRKDFFCIVSSTHSCTWCCLSPADWFLLWKISFFVIFFFCLLRLRCIAHWFVVVPILCHHIVVRLWDAKDAPFLCSYFWCQCGPHIASHAALIDVCSTFSFLEEKNNLFRCLFAHNSMTLIVIKAELCSPLVKSLLAHKIIARLELDNTGGY